MRIDLDVEHLFDGFFYRLYPRIAKLYDFARIGKNYMVMLAIKVRFFILCLILPELMLSNQLTFQQKLNGIVEGGATDPIIFIFHVDVERFDIEMLITIINFLKDGVAFRCFTMSFFF